MAANAFVPLVALLSAATAAGAKAAAHTIAGATVKIEPHCANSVRVRIRPRVPDAAHPVARMWRSASRGDSVLCMAPACDESQRSSGYAEGAVVGYPPEFTSISVDPAAVFYSHAHTDNWVGVGVMPPPDETYVRAFDDGAFLTAPRPGMGDVAVDAYWSATTNHSAVVTSSAPPKGMDFVRVGRLGYLCARVECTAEPSPVPSPPPPPLPVLSGLPGALQEGCTSQPNADAGDNKALTGPVKSGNLIAELSPSGDAVTFSRRDSGAPLVALTEIQFATARSPNNGYATASFTTKADAIQRVYGLGELENTGSKPGGCPNQPNQKSYPLNRAGMSVSLDTTKFHVSVPFYVSSLGYALFVNVPGGGTVSVGNGTGLVEWSLPAIRQLDLWVSALPAGAARSGSMQPLYAQYFTATGMPSPLPPGALKFWQSRLRYRTTDEAVDVARSFGARNVSLGVFVIDFHNQRVNGDFKMDPSCYPDVSDLTSKIAAATGALTMVSLWPDIDAGSTGYVPMHARKCVGNNNIVDPTSGACRRYIWDRHVRPNYWDNGVRAFWLDETDFMRGTMACGPADYCGRWWLNTWIQTFADGVRDERGTPLVLSRGWWPGAQSDGAVLWSSDIFSTFEELRAQVPEGLAASLSGVPWWSTDVGGFGCPVAPYNDSTPYMQELMVRWYQYGALCPIFRTHGCRAGAAPTLPPNTNHDCVVGQGPNGSCGPNEVWSYGAEVERILTRYIRLRNEALAPYLIDLHANVTARGDLTLRPLFFEFPEDSEAELRLIDDQFMLGPGLVVAPVTTFGQRSRQMYLPVGSRWVNFWNRSDVTVGGTWLTVVSPLDTLPLFIREPYLRYFT